MPGITGIQAYENRHGSPEPLVQDYLSAMMPIGSIVGAFWSSGLSGTMTPKWALVYVCFIWIFGCVLEAALPFDSMMYIARCLAGVGAGAMSAIVPVYLVCLRRLYKRLQT